VNGPDAWTARPRVLVLQPGLPHYREPFFGALAERCASLTVLHGSGAGPGFHHRAGAGRRFHASSVRHATLGPVWWMPAMWDAPHPARCDVAVFSWNTRYVQLLPGLLRARARSVATVAWGHGYSKHERPWRRAVRDLAARRADVVLTYGEAAARALVARGVEARRVLVARNAIDQREIQDARRRWLDPAVLDGWQDAAGLRGRPVALFVSRLLFADDLKALLEAWQRVRSQVPEALLLVVGDGPARAELEACAGPPGVRDGVRFLGAIYGEERLAPLFLSARAFAFPRRIGLSLHHAFGYGLPVVAFDDASRHGPEFALLRHGVNGLLVREDDVVELADTLLALLRDPDGARRMGEAGRRLVLDEYSLDTMVEGFVGAIERARELARAA
jgi:glycosyltransferase involved in cell wall biosynthesis